MNPRINQLVKSLLQKESLDQCTLPELQQFADRHPYFGAAQLLLTKKMQTDNPEHYNEQLQKTFLFFHNPLWVEHLLNDNGNGGIEKTQTETVKPDLLSATGVVAPETTIPEPVAIIPAENNSPGIDTPLSETSTITETVTDSFDQGEMPASDAAINEKSERNVTEIKSVIAEPQAKPEVAPKEELLFEPFHTVDYFASQGIKFKEEEKPKDKFGQQLKSFTEWLKTMKRLPVAEIAVTTEPATEKKVEEMAEKSIEEREVLTEAMAEVWEKQGNSVKAIDIYSKLSLLEPSKSAYFAAKIEDLKKLN